MENNDNMQIVSRMKVFLMQMREQNEWVPDATELVFMRLLNKGEKTQKILKNEYCIKLSISEPTLSRSLDVLELGGFIKKTSKRRSGTIITITNRRPAKV